MPVSFRKETKLLLEAASSSFVTSNMSCVKNPLVWSNGACGGGLTIKKYCSRPKDTRWDKDTTSWHRV